MKLVGDGVKAVTALGDGWALNVHRLDIDAAGRRVFKYTLFENGRYVYGDDNLRGPVGVVDASARVMLVVLVDFLLADADMFGRAESLLDYATTEIVAEFANARRAELEEVALCVEEMEKR